MDDDKPFVTELDGPWKDALDLAPRLVLQCLCPRLVESIDWRIDYQSLDDELQRSTPEDREKVRRVDRLLLFQTLTGDPLYLHVEVQCYFDRELGRRVMTYRHRLRGRFGKPVVTLLLLGDTHRNWRPSRHREGQLGASDSCVWIPVKLLDFEPQLSTLETDDNVFGLFLAAHLLTQQTSKRPELRAEHKLRLLTRLQQRKIEDGPAWYRLIDWLMALPPQLNAQLHRQLIAQQTEGFMKYVSFAEQQGIEKGIKQGIEKGEVMGRIRMCQKLLGLSPTSISELSSQSSEELLRLVAELEARLLPGSNGSSPHS